LKILELIRLDGMLKSTLIIFCLIAGSHFGYAQRSVFDVGLRIQKDIGLYTENGISLNYSDKNYAPDRLYIGFSYFTSRLGTAIHSNAIKQDNVLVSCAWYFRHDHLIRPLLRGNLGYFSSEYPSLFNALPHQSLLLSADAGFCIQTRSPLKIQSSLGYNAISGKGNNDVPGTLYPFFYQVTFSWNLLAPKK
jgi:hypothetical protein